MLNDEHAYLSYIIPAFVLMILVAGIIAPVAYTVINEIIDSHNEQVLDGEISETSHYHFDKSVSVFKFFTTIGLILGLVVWVFISSQLEGGGA